MTEALTVTVRAPAGKRPHKQTERTEEKHRASQGDASDQITTEDRYFRIAWRSLQFFGFCLGLNRKLRGLPDPDTRHQATVIGRRK